MLDGTKIKITVSVGISVYEQSPEQFIQAADDALYYSKEMVEIRSVLHLKGKMTRRAYKNTHREKIYELCGCFRLVRQVLLIQRIYDMHRDVLGLRIR